MHLSKVLLALLILRLQGSGSYMGDAAKWAVDYSQEHLLDAPAAIAGIQYRRGMKEELDKDENKDLAVAIASLMILYANANSNDSTFMEPMQWAAFTIKHRIDPAEVPMTYVRRITGME